MILIASEQVWPNLHALLHWSQAAPGLDRIFILHTEDEQRSAQPAQRIHRLLQTAKGRPFRYACLAPLRSIGTRPDDVARAIRSVMSEAEAPAWIIVANGGLKTMSLGLLEAMRSPEVSVVYSEIGRGWQRVSCSPDLAVTSAPLNVPAEEMDRFPLVALVEAQHAGAPQSVRLVPKRPDPLDVVGIARRCMTPMAWDWRAGFGERGRTGPLFERWMGALLLALGVDNVIAQLDVKTDAGRQTAESDLLAIHKGRFFYVELKLIDEETEGREPLVDVLHKATGNCRTFAGAGGIPVVVLPNWQLSDEDLALCSLSVPRVQMLHAAQSGRLISWLAATLGVDRVAPELLDLENEILAWMAAAGVTRAFAPEPGTVSAARTEPGSPFVHVDPLAKWMREQARQNWSLLVLDHEVVFVVESPRGVTCPKGFKKRPGTWLARQSIAGPQTLRRLKLAFAKLRGRQASVSELLAAWNPGAHREATRESLAPGPGTDQPRSPDTHPVRDAFPPAEAVAADCLSGSGWRVERCLHAYELVVEVKLGGQFNDLPVVASVQRIAEGPGGRAVRRIRLADGVTLPAAFAKLAGKPYSYRSFRVALEAAAVEPGTTLFDGASGAGTTHHPAAKGR